MDINDIKSQFPIFLKKINGKPLVYLDSSNSSQKPTCVINRLNDFYKNEFKQKSFNKRVNILIDSNFLVKKNKNLILSKKGKKYLEKLKIVQSIYRVKLIDNKKKKKSKIINLIKEC